MAMSDGLDGQQPRASTSSSEGVLDLPSLLPLSHDHPLLTADSFNVDSFLLTRIHIPLDELRAELREYLGVLREELVQLINDDYEEFISLGTGLRGEGERLKRLERPLGALTGEVEIVRNVLKIHQEAVQEKLDARAGLREEKALLDLLQRLFETLIRAETLATSDDRSKLVGRLADEYTQVVYLCNKVDAEGCKVASSLAPRVAAVREALGRDLETLLRHALETADIARMSSCLKTYDAIEGWADAENVVRAEWRQFCQSAITASALTATSPLVPKTPRAQANPFEQDRIHSDEPLARLFNLVLAELDRYRDLFRLSTDLSERFDFYSRVAWPEVCAALVDNLGSVIFSAGRPDDLHKHYTLTHQFLGLFEAAAPTLDSVQAVRSSAEYDAFERRWQLPVYFQLRWKEIVSAFDSSMSTSTVASPWQLPQSAAAWTAIETCWSDDVFVPELAPRFWRLSCQVASRYKSWLHAQLDATAPANDDRARDDAALRLAASAILDIERFSKLAAGLEIVSQVEGSVDALSISTQPFEERIIEILVRQCSEALKLVRSVASQFRAAPGKASEPAASHFVSSILRPVHLFLDAHPGLRDSHGAAWSARVAQDVVAAYASILASVRKTEDLLRRHRKNKKTTFSLFGSSAAAAPADEHEDEERFQKQMQTDVAALAADADTLGVNAAGLPAWAELKEVIERPGE